MTLPIKISPSILSADYGNLESCVRAAEDGGGDAIHIDIMDGHYVHNFSFGIDVIPVLKKVTNIPLVAHLEIDNPDAFIGDFAQAGSVCGSPCLSASHGYSLNGITVRQAMRSVRGSWSQVSLRRRVRRMRLGRR